MLLTKAIGLALLSNISSQIFTQSVPVQNILYVPHYSDEIHPDLESNKTDTETHIVGKWTSNDGISHVTVNSEGEVIQTQRSPGRMIFPCCGNFSFRRRNERMDTRSETCSYWIYFNKNYSIAYWHKNKGELNECPEGIFRRNGSNHTSRSLQRHPLLSHSS
jgi:hypothetical protein